MKLSPHFIQSTYLTSWNQQPDAASYIPGNKLSWTITKVNVSAWITLSFSCSASLCNLTDELYFFPSIYLPSTSTCWWHLYIRMKSAEHSKFAKHLSIISVYIIIVNAERHQVFDNITLWHALRDFNHSVPVRVLLTSKGAQSCLKNCAPFWAIVPPNACE